MELLLARLNAKVQTFEIQGKGYGGLSQADIAYLLKGLTKIQHELIRAKYCGCEHGAISLYNMIVDDMSKPTIPTESGFGKNLCYVAKAGYRIGLALSLVTDVVYSKRCPKCKGTGYVENKECGVCKGTGYQNLSDRKISDTCGMDHKNFKRYKEIYRIEYERLRGIELSAISRIRANNAQRPGNKTLSIVK